jgi:hypothetical protein
VAPVDSNLTAGDEAFDAIGTDNFASVRFSGTRLDLGLLRCLQGCAVFSFDALQYTSLPAAVRTIWNTPRPELIRGQWWPGDLDPSTAFICLTKAHRMGTSKGVTKRRYLSPQSG